MSYFYYCLDKNKKVKNVQEFKRLTVSLQHIVAGATTLMHTLKTHYTLWQ